MIVQSVKWTQPTASVKWTSASGANSGAGGYIEVPLFFGATDTADLFVHVTKPFTLKYATVRSSDTTTRAASALVAERTYTIYVNGVSKGTVVTSTNTYVISTLTQTSIVAGDVICVSPSGSAGTGKVVSLTLEGI
jgi:hypothetical protein